MFWKSRRKIKKVKSLEKEVANIISNEEVSKSSKIKDLFLLGLTIKDISKKLDIRYQFVYNVVTNFVNTAGIEVVTEELTETVEAPVAEETATETPEKEDAE